MHPKQYEAYLEPTVRLYKDQHARALECVAKITEFLDSTDLVSIKADDTRLLLSRLAGIIQPHLQSEDALLYPALLASKFPETRATAQRFLDETKWTSEIVTKFLERWCWFGEIEGNPTGFILGASTIFAALKRRIEAEESELYPLFLATVDAATHPS